jgi:hypothetical protein
MAPIFTEILNGQNNLTTPLDHTQNAEVNQIILPNGKFQLGFDIEGHQGFIASLKDHRESIPPK